jgi:hypothetical protein
MFKKLYKFYQDNLKVFELRYRKFAKMRGFTTFNDWPYHRRGFLECWAQPGFHKFWQVWNPGIAFFVYRLFLCLGGTKKWSIPTFLSFVLCGFIHSVVVFPFLGWSFSLIGAFSSFALLTIISRKLSPFLQQDKWPTLINILINVGLIIIGFDFGFRIDRLLR